MKIGLVGDSYTAYSRAVNSEMTMNFYPEVQERNGGKNNIVLYRTPGLFRIANSLAGTCRGVYTEPQSGRVFIVNGNQLNEFRFTGTGYTFINIGTLNTATTPVQWASSGGQLAIVSGNQLFVVNMGTMAISLVPGFNPITITFIDGYFVASEGGLTFKNSALLDATDWPDEYTAEQVPDNIINIVSDSRYVWIQGRQSTEIWQVDGSADGALIPVTGAAMLIGCSSRDCTVQADNTFFFLGETRNGDRIAYRADGFGARRVSNHAIEAEWASYNVISDATAYAYIENGHTFWVISFPFQDKTWVYDISNGMWHQRGYWNSATGQFESVRGRYGTFGLGFQIVGDKTDGRVYIQAMRFLDDDGDVIRRVRRTPHTFEDNKRMIFNRLEVIQQVGIGASTGQYQDPQIMLRWSDDGGFTWSNERTARAGAVGQRKTRTYWNKLGSARDRVWEVSVTDAVDWVLIDANVDAVVGYA